MSNMISVLRSAGHQLTDEHLRINLTHNDNIKTFDDVPRYVELEEDRILVDKPAGQAI